MWNGRRRDPVKGALAGAAGGLMGSFAMNQFQAAMRKAGPPQDEQHKKRRHGGEEPSNMKAVRKIFRATLKREMNAEQLKGPANLLHYLFGAAAGAAYGALAEKERAAQAGYGTLFGTVLWVAADEIAVPVSGLSKGPAQYPVKVHASALASHLVYGVTTDLVRRGVRAIT